ncbi:hypothetical protein PILCRDRAFT_642862 [Piloderma croceum F 1598]|uniref:Uncharacterized protein n=1 Tax=Piloderma croceum (strain F 1598) TaxID=765440 RepID=A0A0C3ART3_PILCF|nr:hypothetical protein PILCRDRAFT_642862 [Piloderma croceum F 1598]
MDDGTPSKHIVPFNELQGFRKSVFVHQYEKVAGLKVGASVAYENAFEVSQLQKQSKKLQLPFRNAATHFRIRSLTNVARLGQISPDSRTLVSNCTLIVKMPHMNVHEQTMRELCLLYDIAGPFHTHDISRGN